ncbi:rhodanese-like domain-containing protein [Halococcus saccharolyticus]|uniref:Rhodanese domain-containing protein n=1 Tax=Halococcus saccharolyticus DSM 5350 TaxID=1227455 RepID=M0MJ22_9EURY|nr:rhodanese-like domain-containing protein [Halococcus saccharolyticus]EMA44435.1 rhodanese domain-containing protein [Halococcus saccharolyticus DSM 5350]
MSTLERSAWGLVEEAERDIESISVDELETELAAGETTALDIRDIREVWIEGSIPDAEHAPRGMLEFWADPETEYYKEFFDPDRRYVLYCNEAGRSALAAKRLAEMGYTDVTHLKGGFTAWQEADGEIVDVPQKDYKDQ